MYFIYLYSSLKAKKIKLPNKHDHVSYSLKVIVNNNFFINM